MKVLIADKFEQSGLEGLRAAGCEVVHEPDLKDEALPEAIAETEADVLVVRGTKVTAAMLDAGRLGARRARRRGLQHDRRGGRVDAAASTCPTARARTRSPWPSWRSALILALDRRVPDNVAELRAGRWNKKEYSKAQGLYGRRSACSAPATSAAK